MEAVTLEVKETDAHTMDLIIVEGPDKDGDYSLGNQEWVVYMSRNELIELLCNAWNALTNEEGDTK